MHKKRIQIIQIDFPYDETFQRIVEHHSINNNKSKYYYTMDHGRNENERTKNENKEEEKKIKN